MHLSQTIKQRQQELTDLYMSLDNWLIDQKPDFKDRANIISEMARIRFLLINFTKLTSRQLEMPSDHITIYANSQINEDQIKNNKESA